MQKARHDQKGVLDLSTYHVCADDHAYENRAIMNIQIEIYRLLAIYRT